MPALCSQIKHFRFFHLPWPFPSGGWCRLGDEILVYFLSSSNDRTALTGAYRCFTVSVIIIIVGGLDDWPKAENVPPSIMRKMKRKYSYVFTTS